MALALALRWLAQPECYAVVAMITFGTANAVLDKTLFQLQAVGSSGSLQYFPKPWFITGLMFLSMTICVPLHYLGLMWSAWRAPSSGLALPDAEAGKQPVPEPKDTTRPAAEGQGATDAPFAAALMHTASLGKGVDGDGHGAPAPPPRNAREARRHWVKNRCLVAFPALFDLVATGTMTIALLWVTASVAQMMRGAEVLFASILAVTVLRRVLRWPQWTAVGLIMGGLALVGTSSVLGGGQDRADQEPVSRTQLLAGILLLLFSNAVSAAQLSAEDYFMADVDLEPMELVGWEGVWGTLFMFFWLIILYFTPVSAAPYGLHEDSIDTFVMLGNSSALLGIVIVTILSTLLYNIFAMQVTGCLGAVFRTVLEATRTLFVWLVSLILFYAGSPSLGEPWTGYSYLQAIGFAVLVGATFLYALSDRLAPEQEVLEAMDRLAHGAPSGASAAELELAAAAAVHRVPTMPTVPMVPSLGIANARTTSMRLRAVASAASHASLAAATSAGVPLGPPLLRVATSAGLSNACTLRQRLATQHTLGLPEQHVLRVHSEHAPLAVPEGEDVAAAVQDLARVRSVATGTLWRGAPPRLPAVVGSYGWRGNVRDARAEGGSAFW